MVNSEEVQQIKNDLELVTKTAKVLATKLEKISQRIDEVMKSVGGVTSPVTQAPVSKPAPKATQPVKAAPAAQPEPRKPRTTKAFDSTSTKADRFLDAFLTQLQELKRGREISEVLSKLRDQVMQSAEVGFHPAFHEMGRESSRLKNMGVITEEEREALIEKVYDWKDRIS